MPHLIVEYSANLEDELEIDGLLAALHAAAIDTGVFPPGGCRTRAERRDHYVIADGALENGFVHLMARIGHGRSVETRRAAGERLFAALTGYLDGIYRRRPLGISFEIVEIDRDCTWKQNNLHERMAAAGE